MKKIVHQLDRRAIALFRKVSLPLARLAIFTAYFWFGILKVVGASPANPLVAELLQRTLPFITFEQFIVVFGLFEMLIGVAFFIPGFERLAILLLVPHMVTTTMPLILLPAVTWRGFFVPTLEGQYIIKNLAIIALAFSLAAHLEPFEAREKNA